MASINDLKNSKFLRKEDVGEGVLVTVKKLTQENVALEGVDPELKFAMHFNEFEKPLILNSTNGQIIAQITGHDDNIETAWVGASLVLYTDHNISFQGKLIGGIRVRAPKDQKVISLPF